jgi:enoyl-CoA hydratase/carnithine racemase
VSVDSPTDKVLYDVDESGVATITLNDPGTRNALSSELLEGLTVAFERAVRTCR